VKSNTKSKKIKWLTAILYIVILCLLATGTLAWFIFDKTATIENNGDMQIVAGSRLDISLDDGATWGSNYDVTISQTSYPDITGDGKNFICPMFLDADDNVFANDPNTFRVIDDENENLYYISLRIKFRTAADTEVYLSNESYVKPKNMQVSDINKSIYGNISRDGIAGAVRVSFSEETEDKNGVPIEELRNIWIPNDKYELYYQSEEAKFKETGTREAGYGYQYLNDGKIESYTFSDEDYYSRNVTVGGAEALASPTQSDGSTARVNQAQKLLDFSSNASESVMGIREKTLIVRIWIEGTDREADKALVGGEMSYKLHFICIDKNENPNGEKLEQIELNAENKTLSIPDSTMELSEKVEYSTNGIDWTAYTTSVSYGDKNKYIYIRFVETVADKASEVKVIDLSTSEETG